MRALKRRDCLVIAFRMKQRDAVIPPHRHIFLLMRDERFKFRGGTGKIAFGQITSAAFGIKRRGYSRA